MLHQRSKSADTGLSMAKASSASTHKKKKNRGPPPRDSSLFNQTSQHSALMLPSISRPGGALVRSHSTTNLHNLVSSLHQQREKYTQHPQSSHRKKSHIPPLPIIPSSRPATPIGHDLVSGTALAVRRKNTKKGSNNTHRTIHDTTDTEILAITATTATTTRSVKRNGSLTKKLTDQASQYFRLVKKKSLRSLQGKSSKSVAPEATAKSAHHSDGDIPRIHRADVRVRMKEVPEGLARPLHAEIVELTTSTAGTLLSSNNSNVDEDVALEVLGNLSCSRPANLCMTPSHSPPLPFDTFVQRGIRYHERGELDNATAEFAQAAKERSSVGMFFYGLSLCHGWGCDPQQDLGYMYLSKSASSGNLHILNIEHVLGGTSSEELLAAIYDLGTAFQDGSRLGCQKDEKVASFYFKMASDLGHPDAHYALAKCYQHGLGVEMDLKLATTYYHRAAAPDDDEPSWLYTNKVSSSSR